MHLDATSGAKYRQDCLLCGVSVTDSWAQLEMTLLVPIAVREIRIKTGAILIRVDAMSFLPLSHAVSYCMSRRAHVESDVPKMECNLANYPDAEVRTIIAAVVRARGPAE